MTAYCCAPPIANQKCIGYITDTYTLVFTLLFSWIHLCTLGVKVEVVIDTKVINFPNSSGTFLSSLLRGLPIFSRVYYIISSVDPGPLLFFALLCEVHSITKSSNEVAKRSLVFLQDCYRTTPKSRPRKENFSNLKI